MGMEPTKLDSLDNTPDPGPNQSPSSFGVRSPLPNFLVLVACLLGLLLLVDSIRATSATYDEAIYLTIASSWWQTGEQATISRIGSPLLFWKIQQAPLFWILERTGYQHWVQNPIKYQSQLLPLARLGSLWIWFLTWGLTVYWARRLYGPWAMACAAFLFALSPNLLGHAALITMEMPITACATGMFLLFWIFLITGDRRYFWMTAVLGGLAWSCKYTTVIIPPMLALTWWIDRYRQGERNPIELTWRVTRAFIAFLLIMGFSNLVLTGFAFLPLSGSDGGHTRIKRLVGEPLRHWVDPVLAMRAPQELVGFANQLYRQRLGGSSYLLGERRMHGWWYYYFIALAVKVPLAFWLLFLGRSILRKSIPIRANARVWMLPALVLVFMFITALGSSRNYGIRYLLPLTPLSIVWVSGLAEARGMGRFATIVGLGGYAVAIAGIHPFELTYFNEAAGGPKSGRYILSDSNLDWGQGLRTLARLQQDVPKFQDLTLYYFGATDPRHYDIAGTKYLITAVETPPELPDRLEAKTEFLAVSASLQWGPWGPEGYFRPLDGLVPIAMTNDQTIAIYRTNDLPSHAFAQKPATD